MSADLYPPTLPGTTTVKQVDPGIALGADIQAIYRPVAFATTTTLAAAGIYNPNSGLGIDAGRYRRITGKVFADVGGTLHIETADDNAGVAGTWDPIVAAVTVAANTVVTFDHTLPARWVRLRYVNGATIQATFRLSGYLSTA